MLNIFKEFWLVIILGIISLLLFFNTCRKYNNNVAKSPDTTIQQYTRVDTSYKDSLVYHIKYAVKNVDIIKASQERLDSFSQASKNYDSLANQYTSLKQKYLAYNKTRDTIRLPHNGYVVVADVVSENKIIEREPTILSRDQTITIHDSTVQTITKYAPPTRKILLGGELTGNTSNYINGINGIVAYQDRKGTQYQVKAGLLNTNSNISTQYGAGILWTIKLKK